MPVGFKTRLGRPFIAILVVLALLGLQPRIAGARANIGHTTNGFYHGHAHTTSTNIHAWTEDGIATIKYVNVHDHPSLAIKCEVQNDMGHTHLDCAPASIATFGSTHSGPGLSTHHEG